MTVDGTTFEAGKAVCGSCGPNSISVFLLRCLRCERAFEDSLFLRCINLEFCRFAFDLPYAEVRGRTWSSNLLGEQVARYPDFPHGELIAAGEGQSTLIAFTWDSYYAPRAANRVTQRGCGSSGCFTTV